MSTKDQGKRAHGRDLEALRRVVADSQPLWRCISCGKWSHAKRRPSRHQRWAVTGTETVTELESWDTGAQIEVDVPTRELVKCGPFEAWAAVQIGGKA